MDPPSRTSGVRTTPNRGRQRGPGGRLGRLAAALFVAPFLAPTSALALQAPPNVVVFLADDVGYGDVGPYDHDEDPATPLVTNTPRLDRMTAEGVRMTDFYANAPVCSPTRAALLTGRHSIRHGITGSFLPTHASGLDPAEVTIPEVLAPLGYKSYMVGKWHLGHLPDFLPTSQGFDGFYGVPYSNDMVPFYLLRNATVISTEPAQSLLTQQYTVEAKRYVDEAVTAGAPFFLFVAFTMPHVPVHVSPAFAGITGRGLYEDALYEMDASVGDVLDHIDALGLDADTLVVFTSDNGACDPNLVSQTTHPEPWRFVCGRNAPLSGTKLRFQEGGIRVPLVARWPGVLPAGATTDVVGGVLDLLPTIARAAGAPLPFASEGGELDGFDLFDAWQRGARRPLEEQFFYGLFSGTQWGTAQRKCIRSGNHKLVYDAQALPSLLYDLANDPTESTSLFDPALVATLDDRARVFDCALGGAPGSVLPPHLASGMPTRASSSLACDTSAAAVDGSPTTRWSSATGGAEWLAVDLGRPRWVHEAVLAWGGSFATAYALEVSDDALVWTPVFSEANGDGGLDRAPVERRTRFFRVSATQSSGARHELVELRLHGGRRSSTAPPAELPGR